MKLCAAALLAAGKTLVPLEGDASISRVNETNLGNYVCDVFLRSVPKTVAAKAPGGNVTICMFNAGGIRTGYKVRVCRAKPCKTARSQHGIAWGTAGCCIRNPTFLACWDTTSQL